MAASASQSEPGRSPNRWIALVQSPIGKKLLTGMTGIGLVAFVVIHMLGNLLLLFGAEAYNRYGHWLETLSPLVWLVEFLLVVAIVVHAGLGIRIYLNKRRARPIVYKTYQSAGAPSHQSVSSRTAIWTGLTLAIFMVWHLATFKFGSRYIAIVDGQEMRDLSRLVFEKFHQSAYTLTYAALMGVLGFHLRHGIWSALQSLGAIWGDARPVVAASLVLAVGIAVGFLALPAAIYLGLIG